ncbi:MAG TPA: FMN-binding negative transcriptional regulator [Bryobacteraceae bacterium]|nr:FMN-binding negative transcriptional regulator [Bryobacteraceae bacterium]
MVARLAASLPTSRRTDGIINRMYNSALFAEDRLDVLQDFIRAHPFGTLVANGPEFPEASHLPIFLDASSGLGTSAGLLRCHVTRNNPLVKLLEGGPRVLVIFTGAHHYVTPNWYPSRKEYGKVVPTWNYVAVHATGTARLFEDTPSLLRHVSELTDSHEAGFAEHWSVNDAPPGYVETLSRGIVGVEVAIDRIEGKWKVNQNRPEADQLGVIDGLDALGSPVGREMADVMRKRRSKS